MEQIGAGLCSFSTAALEGWVLLHHGTEGGIWCFKLCWGEVGLHWQLGRLGRFYFPGVFSRIHAGDLLGKVNQGKSCAAARESL